MSNEAESWIGRAVIVNGFDRPCNQMIAIVTGPHPNRLGYVMCRYLCTAKRPLALEAPLEFLAPLASFGRSLKVLYNGANYTTEAIPGATPTARYPDGDPRPWQPQGPEVCPSDAEAMAVYRQVFRPRPREVPLEQ